MPIVHSPDDIALEPAELGQEELYLIGRLVRACALLEDACHLYLSSVVGVGSASLTMLLGQLGVKRKLSLAKNYAAIRGSAEKERFSKLFDIDRLNEVLKCRNAAAHGILLGMGDGKWVFETTTTSSFGADDWASVETLSFKTDDLRGYVSWADDLAEQFAADAYIQEQRKERQNLTLRPSRKSRPKRNDDG